MSKKSPCGGCPPCCKKCIFSADAAEVPAAVTEVVSKRDYGCILPNGGAIVLAEGTLGMMRGGGFHGITPEGTRFLQATGNPLAAHC